MLLWMNCAWAGVKNEQALP